MLHNFIRGSLSLERLWLLRFHVPNSCFVRRGFLVWGSRFEIGRFLSGFCGFLRSILGLFSTRDCWRPYSAIGVRETDENRQLLALVERMIFCLCFDRIIIKLYT